MNEICRIENMSFQFFSLATVKRLTIKNIFSSIHVVDVQRYASVWVPCLFLDKTCFMHSFKVYYYMWCPDTSDILASIQTAALIHHSPFHLPETLLILLSSSKMKSHSQSVPEVYTHFMHYCAEGLVCIDCF